MTQTTIDITEAIAVLEAAKKEASKAAGWRLPFAVSIKMNHAIAALNKQLAGRI